MNTAKIKKIIPKKVWSLLGPLYHFSWGLFANLLYHAPSNKLIVIGVTGTTGKTTSVYLIAKMLNAAGYKTVLLPRPCLMMVKKSGSITKK